MVSNTNNNKAFQIAVWTIFVLAIVGSLIWMRSAGTSKNEAVSPEVADFFAVASDDYVKGGANAKATLIEYIDFECEACGAYFPLVKQLEQDFPTDLRVVLRYFPLPGHRNGMTAALAVEAAARQGKFFEMHDLLYTEQKNWYAEQLGLNMEAYKAAVASSEVKARVERDMNSGKKLGNTGTPSFYLDGNKLPNPQGYDNFKKSIQTAIDQASSKETQQ